MAGLRRVLRFAMLRSRDSNMLGSKSKLASMANNRVALTRAPSATVPPKLEIVKVEKPKNKTMLV